MVELLQEGAKVILEVSDNPERKSKYSLIAVWKNGQLVNIDSLAPNLVAYEALLHNMIKEIGKVQTIKKEVTFCFDLYYEKDNERGFIEVKGITLEKDGIAMFPDAPTSRGTKHLLEMIKAVQVGYKGFILFVVQMKGCHEFIPYWEMDKEFANTLVKASQQGVQILVYDSIVREDELVLDKALEVRLYNK